MNAAAIPNMRLCQINATTGRGSLDWKNPASSTTRQRTVRKSALITIAANQISSFVRRLSWRTSVDLAKEDTWRLQVTSYGCGFQGAGRDPQLVSCDLQLVTRHLSRPSAGICRRLQSADL